jgi:isocitrate lyase
MSSQELNETFDEAIETLDRSWNHERWHNIRREYSAGDVIRLRGSFLEQYTIAQQGSERLWWLFSEKKRGPFVRALGAVTGCQAVQMVKAGTWR